MRLHEAAARAVCGHYLVLLEHIRRQAHGPRSLRLAWLRFTVSANVFVLHDSAESQFYDRFRRVEGA